MVKQYKQNVTMKSKVVITNLDQGKQKVTQLTLLRYGILNHNKKFFLYKCTSNHVSTEKIRSKPNLHFHDFSNFVQHGNWYVYCYSIDQVSCQ